MRQLAEVPVTRLHRLSPKKAAALAEWGVDTVLDLLTTYPRRYIDRTRQADLADLAVGDEAVVLAEVERGAGRGGPAAAARWSSWRCDDGTGAHEGRLLQPALAGQAAAGRDRGALLREARRVPGHAPDDQPGGRLWWHRGRDRSATAGRCGSSPSTRPRPRRPRQLGDRRHGWPRRCAGAGTSPTRCPSGGASRARAGGPDRGLRRHPPARDRWPTPARPAAGWPSTSCSACSWRWCCGAGPSSATPGPSATRCRRSTSRRTAGATAPGVGDAEPGRRFLAGLPFELTAAQRRALAEIFADLAGPLPMHRLLQGDVGSGKTVVAVAALLAAVQGGHQGALMVPDRGAGRAALHGRAGAGRRPDGGRPGTPGRAPAGGGGAAHQPDHGGRAGPAARGAAPAATVDIVVGTHALLDRRRALPLARAWWSSTSSTASGSSSGPRCGTRAARRWPRRASGADPDLLVMTATPIPRTAAMVVFGDLDMTVLDELPPGRAPVTTVWARTDARRGGGLGAGPRARWRPATGPTWSARWSRDPSGWQARSATEELERLSSRGAGRAAPRACCTARCRRPRRRRSWPPSARGEIAGAGGHDRDRGGGGRARGHRDGDRGRRPVRHRPAPPAAGPGRARRPPQLVLPAGRGGDAARRPSAWRRWSGPPTGSSWPRWTSSCGARAPSWGPARRVAATCGWPRCARDRDLLDAARRVAEDARPRPTRCSTATRCWPTRSGCSWTRGRGSFLLQELTVRASPARGPSLAATARDGTVGACG